MSAEKKLEAIRKIVEQELNDRAPTCCAYSNVLNLMEKIKAVLDRPENIVFFQGVRNAGKKSIHFLGRSVRLCPRCSCSSVLLKSKGRFYCPECSWIEKSKSVKGTQIGLFEDWGPEPLDYGSGEDEFIGDDIPF